MSSEFVPMNELEVVLEQVQVGQVPVHVLLKMLVDTDLAVPSAAEVMEDGSGFRPLLFPKEGREMLACFTDKERIGEYSSLTPHCLLMKGRDLLRRMPPGYGLVINPGWSIGFDVSAEGISRIVNDFARRE